MLFSYSLNKAIDFLVNNQDEIDLESSSDEDGYDLVMPIQTEKSNAKTDCGASDDMSQSLMYHIPRCLLNSACRSSLLEKQIKENTVKTKKNKYPSNKTPKKLVTKT